MAARWEILNWAEETLQRAGIVDWKSDSWILYEAVSGIRPIDFLLKKSERMPLEEVERYQNAVIKRTSHIPVQYITGEQDFMGLTFEVNEHVLIPRMDTEVLVLEVEKYIGQAKNVLDMCTGSGCIAVSLKKRNEQLKVTAVDYSAHALEVAKKNSRNLGVEIDFYWSDLFEVFKQSKKDINSEQSENNIQFDIIVSNPPYIPSKVIEGLDEEVRCHEPRMALDGTEDGLEFYRRITRESKEYLSSRGMLFYEIGHDQGKAVSDIMETEGFCDIQVIKDLAGLDRVVYGGMKNV